ncbi:chlI, partial [Symbiodinium microadriaticum]
MALQTEAFVFGAAQNVLPARLTTSQPAKAMHEVPERGAVSAAPLAACGLGLLAGTRRQGRRTTQKRIQCCAVAEKEKTKTKNERPVFPFSAIVGQAEMKLSLILNVIDPKIGGVMIMGDRGTGKTTTIRALVDLLPEIPCIADDPYNSSPDEEEVMSQEVRDRK